MQVIRLVDTVRFFHRVGRNFVKQPSEANTGQVRVCKSFWLLRYRQLAEFVGLRFGGSGGFIDLFVCRAR